ncbi:MAG TPA: hypothetical protein VGR35_13155 [Tepidisphaeraceae bacterium]|nr:hypothetical protein [Tepidisphaeraceae bacterium]
MEDRPRRFFVADFNVRGELRAIEEYRYDDLERIPGAGELIIRFSTALYRAPQTFELSLPSVQGNATFRWLASAETAGIATLRHRSELTSISLLASGLDPQADHLTLEAFQHHLVRELHDTGVEPSFALMDLRERPVVATTNFKTPDDQTDQLIAALSDRCFAASYFRYLNLA